MSIQSDKAVNVRVPMMAEQIEKLRYYADLANVPLSQFLREAGELLACEMAQYHGNPQIGENATCQIH